MNRSWRTTTGAILSAIGLGMRQNELTAPWADVVQTIGIALIGLSARDNKVTSEEAKATK